MKSSQNGDKFYAELEKLTNHRGFLPRAMTIIDSEEDLEPDYVIVINDSRGDCFLKQLSKEVIKYETFISNIFIIFNQPL